MNWLEVKRFNKGIVSTSRVGIGVESDGIVRYAANVRLKSGNVVSREGYERYMDFHLQTALDNLTIRALGEYQREAYSAGVVSYFRAVVFTADNTFWYVQPEVSLTHAIQIVGHPQSSNEFRYVNVYDHLWIFNGVDPVYTWDGITVYKAGIPKPTGTLAAVLVDTAGAYSVKYKMTYYRSAAPYDKESESTSEITLAGISNADPVDVDVTYTLGAGEVIDTQVTHIHLYRTDYWDPTTDEEPTAFYLLPAVTIAAFVAAAYVYNDVQSTVNTSTHYDVTERGVPPVSHYGLWHDSRLFLAGDPENPSVVYYSEVGKPWYFPALNYDEVNRDDGSIITGLGAIGPTRYIFKERLIYEWTGNPVTATPIRQVERPDATQNMARVAVGCASPDTLVGWNNSIIFRSMEGDVWMLSQEALVNLSKYYTGVKDIGNSPAAYVKDDYYIIGGSNCSYACYLPTQSWESADDIKFNYVLVRQNGDVLVPSSYIDPDLHTDKQGAEYEATVPVLNRLHQTTTDNLVEFTKSFQTKYIKVADNNDVAIIRSVRVYSTVQLPFYMTITNESGDNVVGLYDVTLKRFNLGTPLYAKWVSVRLSWSALSTEIFGVDVGYIRRVIH
jgi:hypothetical protein